MVTSRTFTQGATMKAITTACALFVASIATANEVKVAEHDVPKLALDAVDKKYPGAKKVGFEREDDDGKVTYEINLVDGARHIDIDVSPTGTISSEEEVIAASELPAPVREALAHSARYASWTVKRVERVIRRERAPTYEVLVARGKNKAELVFADDGKLVTTESSSATR